MLGPPTSPYFFVSPVWHSRPNMLWQCSFLQQLPAVFIGPQCYALSLKAGEELGELGQLGTTFNAPKSTLGVSENLVIYLPNEYFDMENDDKVVD